ncbi:MAG TPA: L,D-transpeptidase family protein [Acidimicrobiales bacterium]|nr:L,D-transpeptidase family protein [Acidimicrobiales bacterium]
MVAVLLAACSGGSPAAQATTRGGAAEEAGASSTTGPAPTTGSSTTTTTEAPATTEAPTTTTTEPPAPAPPAIEVGDLRSGSDGPRTKALQEALDRLGFDPGEADGAFGTKTTLAVWAYQALTGRPQDGVVTAELEQAVLTSGPIPMLRPDLGPTHTEVDLDKQVLLVWGDGVLELATHVSSGSGVAYCEDGHCGDAVTPVGDYRYQRRIAGERHAPLGVLYNPVYFNGGIAVHGAGSVPARPASHGCVRIPMHISDYFQSLVADGEPIAVFRGGTGPAAPVAAPGGPAAPPPAGAENGG